MAIIIDRDKYSNSQVEITFGGLGDGWGSSSFEIRDGQIYIDPDCYDGDVEKWKVEIQNDFLNHCTTSIKNIKKVLDLIGIDGKQWIISQMTEDTPEDDRDGLEDAYWSGFRDANMVAKLTKKGDE